MQVSDKSLHLELFILSLMVYYVMSNNVKIFISKMFYTSDLEINEATDT